LTAAAAAPAAAAAGASSTHDQQQLRLHHMLHQRFNLHVPCEQQAQGHVHRDIWVMPAWATALASRPMLCSSVATLQPFVLFRSVLLRAPVG
jgi:hypothetical protein